MELIMDDFPGDFRFDNEQLETSFSILDHLEIIDAINRILRQSNLSSGYTIAIGDPSPTDNPQVSYLDIVIICEYGSVPKRCEYTVWVDGFVLAFTLIDDVDWANSDNAA
jgi:hypothetical protein